MSNCPKCGRGSTRFERWLQDWEEAVGRENFIEELKRILKQLNKK